VFISDSLIYLELQKTGCTHIGRLLAQLVSGKQVGKHNRLPARLRNDRRPIIGSIRNPWDWYLSLWGYGCDGKGTLYHKVTSHKAWFYELIVQPGYALRSIPSELRKPMRAWRDSYRSSDDPACFREWLHLVCAAERQHEIGEGYAEAALSRFAGLMTYRYLRLFCRHIDDLFDRPELFTSPDDLAAFDREQNLLSFTIRTERLEDDLIQALHQCGVALSDEQIQTIRGSSKTNTSSRKRSLAYYYDRDTLELVRSREQFLIAKYGYAPPEIEQR
jgi:hypothetical protein